MTVALCMFCGEEKVGAFSDCDKCKKSPSGDEELDIFFTDWHFPKGMLEQFGNLAKELKAQNKDPIPIFRTIMLNCTNDESLKFD